MASRPPDPASTPGHCHLSESEWQDLRGLVTRTAGIKLSEAKRPFLISRLLKRLRATGVSTFRDYFRYVVGAGGGAGEHQQLINAVTTNKTNFFRESAHFEILTRWLNNQTPDVRQARARGLRIWCAASSTGEEPYTIAAVLREALSHDEWLASRVFASDIDTSVLQAAHRAVYERASVEAMDKSWRTRMFVQGTGKYRDRYRVRRDLRDHVELFQLNLTSPDWQMQGVFDVVFCRNVLIYFERPVQEQVVQRLLEHTAGFGLLVLGHSETLNGAAVSATSVGPSVYTPTKASAPERRTSPQEPTPSSSPAQLREPSRRRPSLFASRRPNRTFTSAARLRTRLEDAVLLVMYDEIDGRSAAAVIQPTPGEALAQGVLREARRMGHSLRHTPNEDRKLTTKIVTAGLSEHLAPDDWSPLNQALAEENMQLAALRQFDGPLRIELEPRAGRIRLRQSRGDSVEPPSPASDCHAALDAAAEVSRVP